MKWIRNHIKNKNNLKMDGYVQYLHKEFEIKNRKADVETFKKMAGQSLKKFEAWIGRKPRSGCF